MTVFTIPLVLVAVAVFGLTCYLSYKRRDNERTKLYPPGPPSLPLIGNLHQLGKRSYLTLWNWVKVYGKIYRIKLGLDDAIVVSDAKLIKELFKDPSASGRIQSPVFLAMSEGPYGIVNTEGEAWEAQRRFVLRKLRDFGFAKSSMEGVILDEARIILDWFSRKEGMPILCNRLFNAAVVNSVWHIVSGQRAEINPDDPSDSEILRKSDNLIRAFEAATKSGLLYAPFLRYIIPGLSGWSKLVSATDELSQVSLKTIDSHVANLNRNNPLDLIDHYLLEKESAQEPTSSFFKETGERNLKAVIIDLFEAGNETTSTTLAWAMLYLAHHPQTQDRLINEIYSVIGTSRQPSLTDKASLPFTEAVIMEVLRASVLLPTGVMHRMLTDKILNGFLLPKHAIVIANLHAVLQDPKIWGDPQHFRPDRFLSADGKTVVRHEAFIPFSTGKRVCLGETLAKDTLFLFITSIFQKFEVRPDPDNPKPDFEPEIGFINIPKPFKVVVKTLAH